MAPRGRTSRISNIDLRSPLVAVPILTSFAGNGNLVLERVHIPWPGTAFAIRGQVSLQSCEFGAISLLTFLFGLPEIALEVTRASLLTMNNCRVIGPGAYPSLWRTQPFPGGTGLSTSATRVEISASSFVGGSGGLFGCGFD